MKTRHFLVLLCMLSTTMGFAQNQLFEKYADMDNVTSVYISKAMFEMMPNIENAGADFSSLKGKIESLQLVTTDKPGVAGQLKTELSQIVTTRHEELMRVRDGKTRVNFYSDIKSDQITELIMLVEDEGEFTAILLTGSFTLKDIQDIANQY